MKLLAVLAVILAISGCQSMEEITKWEERTLVTHKRIFVECRAQSLAFLFYISIKERLRERHELKSRSNEVLGKCLVKNLPGLVFHEVVPTTSLDIRTKKTLRFITGGDPEFKKFFERSKEWNIALHDGKEPFDGYWREYEKYYRKWTNEFEKAK